VHQIKYFDGEFEERVQKAKEIDITTIIRFNASGKALCPHHKDSSPSLQLWKEKNLASCFVCYKWWDTIGLYQEVHGVSFGQALDALVPRKPKEIKKYLK
jgi:DNA primase